LNYDDPVAVDAEIPPTWWLEHNSCKFILSVLVHKDNKDISTNPTMLPPGPTRSDVRAKANKTVQKKREATKLTHQHPVSSSETNGSVLSEDVEHEAKKARVDGMRSVIDKNKVEAINAQISVMRQLEDVYVSRMGRDRYELQLVNLVNQMPGMLMPQQQVDLHTPTSEPSQIHQDADIEDAFD
jgi:hypothetical protein